VRVGDTLWRIAREHSVTVEKLCAANNLSADAAIVPGQILKIPEPKPAPPIGRVYPVTTSRRGFAWPVKGKLLVRFNATVDSFRSTGLTITAKKGAPILASKGGKVTFASDGLQGWGKVAVIDHGGGLQTWYAHSSKLFARRGQTVQTGQKIAEAGSTGRALTPRLHFKLFVNGVPTDPMGYLP